MLQRRKILPGAVLIALLLTSFLALPALGSRTATTTVSVRASDLKFALSRKVVPKGTVIFKVVNRGAIAHDFKIKGKRTPLLNPGQRATLKVVFTKAGKYPYLCTIPGHAAAGMKGILTVK